MDRKGKKGEAGKGEAGDALKLIRLLRTARHARLLRTARHAGDNALLEIPPERIATKYGACSIDKRSNPRRRDVLLSLKRETRDWLLRNCIIRESRRPAWELGPGEQLESSYVVLTKHGYVLFLGNDLDCMSHDQQLAVVFHEIAHILRGDCLIKGKNKREHLIQGIAMDSVINAGFRDFRKLFPLAEAPMYYYPEIACVLEGLPRNSLPPWRVVFDAIMRRINSGDKALEKLLKALKRFDKSPSMSEDMNRDEAEKIHVKVVLEARDSEELQEIAAGFKLASGIRRAPIIAQPLPAWARTLENLTKSIKRHTDGVLMRVRTYNRPGRVEGLRGVSRQPRMKVSVILDVSSSCSFLESIFRGLASTLRRHHTVDLGVFASEFRPIRHPGQNVSVPDGTIINSAMKALERMKPELGIVLTDGEFFDTPMLPRCPVWFVVYGNQNPAWKNRLRPIDRIFHPPSS